MKKISFTLIFLWICNFSFGQSSFFPIKKGTTLTYAYGKELYQGQNVDVSQLRMEFKILNETKTINGKITSLQKLQLGDPLSAFT